MFDQARGIAEEGSWEELTSLFTFLMSEYVRVTEAYIDGRRDLNSVWYLFREKTSNARDSGALTDVLLSHFEAKEDEDSVAALHGVYTYTELTITDLLLAA